MARRFRRSELNAIADNFAGAHEEVRHMVQAAIRLGHTPTLASIRIFYAVSLGRQFGMVRTDTIQRGQREWMPEDQTGRPGGAFSPSQWLSATLRCPALAPTRQGRKKVENPLCWQAFWADDIVDRTKACLEISRRLG